MRIGTRGSALALAQARVVADGVDGDAELVVVGTSGDESAPGEGGSRYGQVVLARAREDHRGGDKSRWVAGLERALLAGEIDLAVHSAKDVPGELAEGLVLIGAPPRAAANDVLIGARSLEDLQTGARVGTSSLRRAAQLRAVRADIEVVGVRGNVDTRLAKLAGGRADRGGGPRAGNGEPPLDALVLAGAGLARLGRSHEVGCELDTARFVPAPGQGTLALQARAGDAAVRAAVESILDERAFACLRAERALASALSASCDTPLGAHATPEGCGCLYLRAWIGLPDGGEWIADELMGGFYDPEELGRRLAERMRAVGAEGLLQRAQGMLVERT
jgi:hydroxymethylbilane synthase